MRIHLEDRKIGVGSHCFAGCSADWFSDPGLDAAAWKVVYFGKIMSRTNQITDLSGRTLNLPLIEL